MHGRQALYAKVIGDAEDQLVDPSVCDCCQLSLTATDDGAVIAYRGRTADDRPDLKRQRLEAGVRAQKRVGGVDRRLALDTGHLREGVRDAHPE